ncbi:rhomboid family intramembrane serine protease [Engelhardtia mirabilis]|uniref:Rhomboid family protein n=1 Tax=Engelhardtia mirabilis TaxID=2528011 RepID=A0A518BJN5_9BACT|nr:Rhomboid family protein [Planctomycetes bacterium Pla133]QDV01514.1 Rhomboid family protein [Planctomycetes bacterium Pla86]
MQTSEYQGGGSSLALPGLTPVVKWLLISMAAVWGVELVISLVNPDWISSVTLGTRVADGALVPEAHWGGLFGYFGATPGIWFDRFPWLFPWQVLTYGFLHGVSSPLHLLFNLLGIYFFGTMVEGTIGSRRFLQFFLIALAAGGITSLLLKPLLMGSSGPTVGASAGVMAILCCAATMQPRATVLLLFFPLPLAWLAIGLVGMDAFFLIQELAGRGTDFKDHLAHLAGAGFGFLAARRGLIWQDWGSVVEAKVAEHKAQGVANDEGRLDELLIKIQKEGIHSLSERERAFLKRMSDRR